ncbi:MAG: 4Fe-4S binding protein [Hydrogenoanaerobacterium sp.]
MRVAVLSGKGGTGKTFVAVNLAAAAGKAVYIDCDVEEPNGRLFFKPQSTVTKTVTTLIPQFDTTKCNACRECVNFCRFNALVFVKDKPMLFADVCHSCGGCVRLCKTSAITEKEKPVGVVECGESGLVYVVTGIMNLGEASGIPVIKAALSQCAASEALTVIDCPPGSACPVMESVMNADYCIIVAEPTAFGLHNFKMVYELVGLLKKPCGVVINKADEEYAPLNAFCAEENINVLCTVPYSRELAAMGAKAEIAVEHDSQFKDIFCKLLYDVKKGALA